MQIDLNNPDAAALERAAAIVRNGGVVCYPADTIYGLGCAPGHSGALRRLLELKGRPLTRGVACLVPSVADARWLADGLPAAFYPLVENFWPGPLTLVVAAARTLPPELVGGRRTVAVRHPASSFLQRWMEKIPGPLVSTSANPSGQPPSNDPGALRALFGDAVDLYIEAECFIPTEPSTVVDLTAAPPRLIRRGASADDVLQALRRL